jgi:hypothetical protein
MSGAADHPRHHSSPWPRLAFLAFLAFVPGGPGFPALALGRLAMESSETSETLRRFGRFGRLGRSPLTLRSTLLYSTVLVLYGVLRT